MNEFTFIYTGEFYSDDLDLWIETTLEVDVHIEAGDPSVGLLGYMNIEQISSGDWRVSGDDVSKDCRDKLLDAAEAYLKKERDQAQYEASL